MDWREHADDEGRGLIEFIKEEHDSIICVACNIKIMSKDDAFENIEKHIRTIKHGSKLYEMIHGKNSSVEIIDLTNSDTGDTYGAESSRKRNFDSTTPSTSDQVKVENKIESKRQRLVQGTLDWKVIKNTEPINKIVNKNVNQSRPTTSTYIKQEDKSWYKNFDINQSTTQVEGPKIPKDESTSIVKYEDLSRPSTSSDIIIKKEDRWVDYFGTRNIGQLVQDRKIQNQPGPSTSTTIQQRNEWLSVDSVQQQRLALSLEGALLQLPMSREDLLKNSNVPLRPGKRNKRKPVGEEEEPDEEGEIGMSDTYADYEPIKLKIGATHPYPVVESVSLSSVLPPDILYQLSIPKMIITKGFLSALQLESILYASQAHMKILPDGSRAGFFIGDGAGVGKGRTIAGIIFENYMCNRRKALWVSYSTDLQVDAERDLADVGASHIKTNLINKFKYNKISKTMNEGVLFTTYQSLIGSTKSKNNRFKTRLEQIIEFLGKDFDGCIVFDECHKAKNLVAESSKKPTKTGKIVLDLQLALPNARVVYSSATGASTPRNMAYMVRLGIWGENTPFKTFGDFISVVEKRGVGTMEIIAMDMKLRGMYIARQLSFRGVKFNIHEIPFSNKFAEAYDRAVDLWVEAKNIFEQASNLVDDSPVGERSLWMQFWRTHQRFFQYFCIAAKVEHLAQLALDAVKNGKCAVIGLQLTGEGPTNQFLRRNNNITEFISAAQICFESLVESQFPRLHVKRRKVNSNHRAKRQRFDESDFESDIESDGQESESDDLNSDTDDSFESDDDIPLTSRIDQAKSENDYQNRGKILLEMKKSLLRKIKDLGPYLPPNTLDYLIHCLGGTQNVAEMTGRKGRIVQNSGKVTYEARKDREISLESVNLTEKERFMNGDKLIAIISEAASSGISLHSDRRVKNQRQRVHYTLELPWSADRAIQQFGRTHRSNQVNSPECVILISNLAGERRFASVIAKRLETLGALLHGDRRASESRDLSQFNIDTKYGRDALENVLTSIVNERSMNSNVPLPPTDYLSDFYKDIQNALIGVGLIIEHSSTKSLKLDFATDSKEPEVKSLRLSNGYKKIPTFLNRILGSKVELQNRLFKYFTDTLSACINHAKKMGTYDKGILDLGSGEERVTRISTIRFIRPLDNGTAIIDLQKFHIVRGMDWDRAMSINAELSNKIEGFYLSLDSGGRTGKRTAILVALNQARGSDGIRVYRPHIANTNEYFSDIKTKYYKVDPKLAQYHWEYQFKSSLTTCRHAFFNGNCKNVTIGIGCEFGLRTRTYGVLSGSVLSTWNMVEKVLVGNTNRKIQVIRIKVNDDDKIFGTLVPNDRFDYLQKVLEEGSVSVELINH